MKSTLALLLMLASGLCLAAEPPPVDFLIKASASDFHKSGIDPALQVRDVRMGHVATADGRQYLLCGEFMAGNAAAGAEWTTFATIKTSGYEQWLGASASGLCERKTITWDAGRDLTPRLQGALDKR